MLCLRARWSLAGQPSCGAPAPAPRLRRPGTTRLEKPIFSYTENQEILDAKRHLFILLPDGLMNNFMFAKAHFEI